MNIHDNLEEFTNPPSPTYRNQGIVVLQWLGSTKNIEIGIRKCYLHPARV